MSLLSRIRDVFRPAPPPSKLRNKPGGLAWIKVPSDDVTGADVLNRRIVTTVRTDGVNFWAIDPPQEFQARAYLGTMSGRVAAPGTIVTVQGMHDDLLEPIRDVGDHEQDESTAWLPPVPVVTKEPEHA